MGANSTQGIAVLLLLIAFTSLAGAFFAGGSFLYIAVFVVAAIGAAALFIKVKPLEHAEH